MFIRLSLISAAEFVSGIANSVGFIQWDQYGSQNDVKTWAKF